MSSTALEVHRNWSFTIVSNLL
jgi:hypothetical protein